MPGLEPGIHAVVGASDCGSGMDPRVKPEDDEMWRWAGVVSARRGVVLSVCVESARYGEQDGEARHTQDVADHAEGWASRFALRFSSCPALSRVSIPWPVQMTADLAWILGSGPRMTKCGGGLELVQPAVALFCLCARKVAWKTRRTVRPGMRRMSPIRLRVGRPALLSGFRHARP